MSPRVISAIADSLALISLALATHSEAAPITLVPNTLNMFRDTRGINDVGIGQGDFFQYGAAGCCLPEYEWHERARLGAGRNARRS